MLKVKVVLTKSAKEFITPLSISSLSQEKVYEDIFVLKMSQKWIIFHYQDGLI